MPDLTGVAILDFFIYLAAVMTGADIFATAALKLIDVFRGNDKQFGRREGDLGEVKKATDDHERRLATVETDVAVSKERDRSMQQEIREFKETFSQHRAETRENTIKIFDKLDGISRSVRNGHSG